MILKCIPRDALIQKDTFTSIFIVALFTLAKTWKKPKYPQQMTGLRRYDIHVQWNITQP